MKLKKGDKVKITTGKDKGKEGVIERVYDKREKVLIPGLNLYKKHVKKNEQMPKGGIVEVPRPVVISNVMLICKKCGKITRVGYKTEADRKVRMCRKCKSAI